MATQANLIATYQSNPTLQNRYTQQEYLDMFGFGAQQPTPTPDPDPTPTPPSDGIQNIIGQNLNQGGGGGVPTSPAGLTQDFMTATQERQNRLTNPNKVQSFINNFTGTGQRDIGAMIKSGVVDERLTSGIPLGISGMIAKALPDKYYDMSLGDQVFTQSQMGYTGPTVFGENTSGLNKDPFGLNTRSAFGNYSEAVGKDFASLSESLSGRLADKYGVEFDEETGMFVGTNAKKANEMTKMMRTKFNFRKQQLDAKNRLDAQIKAAEEKRKKEAAAEQAAREASTAARAMAANPEVYRNAGITSGGFASQNTGTNENFSNKTGRGRTGYDDGGRVYLYHRLK
jgi:hypothetical protein